MASPSLSLWATPTSYLIAVCLLAYISGCEWDRGQVLHTERPRDGDPGGIMRYDYRASHIPYSPSLTLHIHPTSSGMRYRP